MDRVLSKIGIGTSMLFNGLLRNSLNEKIRAEAFSSALYKGINVVHTNAKLGTQKKACHYMRCHHDIFHITKTESDLQSTISGNLEPLLWRIRKSIDNCPQNTPQCISIEVDHKRNYTKLSCLNKLKKWYQISIYAIFEELGYKPKILAMCKTRHEYETALCMPDIDYIGGYTNIKQAGLLNEILINGCHKPVIGFSPFARGKILDIELSIDTLNYLIEVGVLKNCSCSPIEVIRELSFRVALAPRDIKSVVVGVGTREHLNWALEHCSAPAISEDICLDILRQVSGKDYEWS